jgi:hypothetical protein
MEQNMKGSDPNDQDHLIQEQDITMNHTQDNIKYES